MSTIVEALKYVKAFSGTRLLIKLGGAVLEDDELIGQLCEDLALVRAAGISLVIVHGGGQAINNALKTYDIDWTFHQGQRVTTDDMMQVIEMVLCGRINKKLVRGLNIAGVPAVGLSGVDHNMLQCQVVNQQLGRVGKIKNINTDILEDYLASQQKTNAGLIPIVAPVGVNAEGQALNVNADWAASRIAAALGITKLIYVTDQDGIYNQQGERISVLEAATLADLIAEGTVKEGMLTKANTILDALANGIENIHIINGKQPHVLIEELFTDQGVGTVCKTRAN